MKRSRKSAILTALLLLAASGIVRAQTHRAHIGPHVGYNFDLDDVNVGAQFSIPLFYRVEIYPSFDYYFRDPGSAWALNGDLKWRVFKDNPRWFYLGTGINLTTVSVNGNSNSDAGWNLFIGAESLRKRIILSSRAARRFRTARRCRSRAGSTSRWDGLSRGAAKPLSRQIRPRPARAGPA